MSDNLFYLLTLLPSLPNLGEPLTPEDAMAKIREESDAGLLLLADLLDVENEIDKCALHYYVQGSREYTASLSERLPDSFHELFASYHHRDEADWLTAIYAAWFELLLEVGDITGSGLLKEWAKWEYALRTRLRIERLRAAGRLPADVDAIVPEFMKELSDLPDQHQLVEAARASTEPMKAEKMLDQARIDYLRRAVAQFSFSVDELVAYMLELRIHQRYARLSPEKGRKLLEEVTRL
ncbi:MAG: hypothetical protein GQF41_1475 [Candidatus Rifleibacterium amylolyticum]|nr:MAG: hypothetical protein GQF41_1475 [Candidatus Rifleibacterium amylolyticum]